MATDGAGHSPSPGASDNLQVLTRSASSGVSVGKVEMGQVGGVQVEHRQSMMDLSSQELADRGEHYARQNLGPNPTAEVIRDFQVGAILAKHADDPPATAIDAVQREGGFPLTDKERSDLEKELTHKWRHPSTLYNNVVICSLSAAVMGMDETVVNGAQGFYKKQFGIDDGTVASALKLGVINAAPYLCCAFFACWMTQPLNKWLGRRGTVIAVSFLSALGCVLSALAQSPASLGISRAILGLGIGPNSATTPMFAAECAPKRIRGALVMQWQVWTAFGIMIGYATSIAFYRVQDSPHPTFVGTNWRLMLASAGLPAVLVICLAWLTPESPRWYLTKGKHRKAHKSMLRLRNCSIQACRDLFHAQFMLEEESKTQHTNGGKLTWFGKVREIGSVQRNRRALVASEIVMFLQQFSGVNIIAYYSSEIFIEAKMPPVTALATSLGFGAVNFIFALPAFFTIDKLGRRFLLLVTVPLMALALLATGGSFWIPEGHSRTAVIATSIYLFGALYSPGAGPVPFTYSAEAYPLYVRPLGMSIATATTWFFNSMLALTWPMLMKTFKPQGAFGFYAFWNLVAWVLILLFVPETKDKTLEELDHVFDVTAWSLAKYGVAELRWAIARYVFRRKNTVAPVPPSRSAVITAQK